MFSYFLLCICFPCLLAAPPQNQRQERAGTIVSENLVTNVKEINIYLNIPADCSSVYDGIIQQLENCRVYWFLLNRSGSNRGHPKLTSGCLLKLDLSKYRTECSSSKVILFPETGSDVEFPLDF
ncbi:uncharacterized protein LOC111696877 isoform X2 [Eurytemora carolleeae]|uniref:uncharacterized protein LOC111696877 isoform X2 n=1 Tax=Eurytemora carolleeae TaxID=1294199 RepID=UPI000C7885EF|nr:uncharacterized protein LOC111696877 isoform X2 [Eurytemora carolleeae]|eukprot:XP_023322399.1 uncharacterized protein LOC111696877 isoform X2 [Eurytemora affinis]